LTFERCCTVELGLCDSLFAPSPLDERNRFHLLTAIRLVRELKGPGSMASTNSTRTERRRPTYVLSMRLLYALYAVMHVHDSVIVLAQKSAFRE